MTIIAPNKKNKTISLMLYLSIIFFFTLLGYGIYLYNKNVNLRHEISRLSILSSKKEAEIVNLEAKAANIIQASSLDSIALKYGLGKDLAPKYLEVQLSAVWQDLDIH